MGEQTLTSEAFFSLFLIPTLLECVPYSIQSVREKKTQKQI